LSGKGKARARDILVGLAVAAAVVGLLELGLRLTVPESALLFNWEHPEGYLTYANELNSLGHEGGGPPDIDTLKVRPNRRWKECTSAGELRFVTERHGFREEREVPRRAPPGTWRALALGDSWIFGVAQSQGETIAARLEALLKGRMGDREVEVINAGVPGSTGFDMLRRWRSLVNLLEFDALILGRPHNVENREEAFEARASWYRSVRGAPYFDLRIYLALRRVLAPLTRSPYAHLKGGEGSRYEDLDQEIQEVGQVVAEARARGIPSYVFLLPHPFSHQTPSYQEAVEQGPIHPGLGRWVDELAPLGARFYGHALAGRACWGADDPTHPGRTGAAILARGMAEVIATGKWRKAVDLKPACPTDTDHGRPACGAPGRTTLEQAQEVKR